MGCSLTTQPLDVKCNISGAISASKKQKRDFFFFTAVIPMFVSDVTNTNLEFNPLSHEVAQAVCKQLKVESEKVHVVSTEVGVLGAPCSNENTARLPY